MRVAARAHVPHPPRRAPSRRQAPRALRRGQARFRSGHPRAGVVGEPVHRDEPPERGVGAGRRAREGGAAARRGQGAIPPSPRPRCYPFARPFEISRGRVRALAARARDPRSRARCFWGRARTRGRRERATRGARAAGRRVRSLARAGRSKKYLESGRTFFLRRLTPTDPAELPVSPSSPPRRFRSTASARAADAGSTSSPRTTFARTKRAYSASSTTRSRMAREASFSSPWTSTSARP